MTCYSNFAEITRFSGLGAHGTFFAYRSLASRLKWSCNFVARHGTGVKNCQYSVNNDESITHIYESIKNVCIFPKKFRPTTKGWKSIGSSIRKEEPPKDFTDRLTDNAQNSLRRCRKLLVLKPAGLVQSIILSTKNIKAECNLRGKGKECTKRILRIKGKKTCKTKMADEESKGSLFIENSTRSMWRHMSHDRISHD